MCGRLGLAIFLGCVGWKVHFKREGCVISLEVCNTVLKATPSLVLQECPSFTS